VIAGFGEGLPLAKHRDAEARPIEALAPCSSATACHWQALHYRDARPGKDMPWIMKTARSIALALGGSRRRESRRAAPAPRQSWVSGLSVNR
jgi:hypothetical protein